MYDIKPSSPAGTAGRGEAGTAALATAPSNGRRVGGVAPQQPSV